MFSEKLQALAAARAKVAELEQSVAADLNRELAGLPAKYGFGSAGAFVAAVRSATGKRRGRKPGMARTTAVLPNGLKKRRRAKITDATRMEVKKLVESGNTGNEIATALGISLQSVQNIKTSLGLVKRRK
ncbi:MAG TPA: helix-turn-helix domain-containing protein [Candidatus Paceibacterota bacterium]|nr:helix-turn-helix domain-containing protein [Candidatus Paceibacterota bacterium]